MEEADTDSGQPPTTKLEVVVHTPGVDAEMQGDARSKLRSKVRKHLGNRGLDASVRLDTEPLADGKHPKGTGHMLNAIMITFDTHTMSMSDFLRAERAIVSVVSDLGLPTETDHLRVSAVGVLDMDDVVEP
jgi:hypothetical protein